MNMLSQPGDTGRMSGDDPVPGRIRGPDTRPALGDDAPSILRGGVVPLQVPQA